MGKGLSAKTIRNIHGVPHGVLESAIRDEILLRNVSKQCTLPHVVQRQIKAITTDELAAFLAAVKDEPFRNIFFLDILSGLRQAEILGLCWEDIDWQNNCIYIRSQLQQKQEAGDFSYYLASPKEGKERKIVLVQSAMQTLQKHRMLQKNMCAVAEPVWHNQFNLVFTNDFGRPLNRWTVYKHLKRVLRAYDMGDHTFHALWHSFAMISLENGDDIKTGQANLGYYAASFTLKVHVSDRVQQSSAARMEELIASLPSLSERGARLCSPFNIPYCSNLFR